MKWLGKHIVDLIARFRSDVYLEDISTGTIASGGNLGLDSNNKIVKQDDAGITDLHGAGVDGAANQLLTDDGDGTVTSEANLTFDGTDLSLASAGKMEFRDTGAYIYSPSTNDLGIVAADTTLTGNALLFNSEGPNRPHFYMTSNYDDANGPIIYLQNLRDGDGLEDGDVLGGITFLGEDVAGQYEQYGSITGSVIEADSADEAGQIQILVANDGTERNGITMTADKGTAAEIDVTIANGAASTTTIAGTLTMGSTAAMTNAGLLSVANQSSITGLGTIGTGTWQGARIASDHLDIDTAHLTTDQTFSGVKTFDETIVGSINGSAATVTSGSQANITTLAGVTSIGTDGDTLSILGDNLTMSNATAYKPLVKLINTTDDVNGPYLELWTKRTAGSVQGGEDGDILGTISFAGYDSDEGEQYYAYIQAKIHDATAGEESGRLDLKVANHDGGLNAGLTLMGGSEANEVDVVLGLGANSVVTIPGNIDLAGDIDVDGTLEVDAFKGTGSTTVTNILDEDAMGSNSATALATQQSIKAYADTKRPNLYWFGVCDAATTSANKNLGAFPSTDVSIVSFENTTLTNDTDVFTLDTDEVTIARAGVYKFTYNVLLEITAGSNRTEGAIGILRTPSGGSVGLIDGSRSSTYNRFNAAADAVSRGSGSVSMLIDVAVDDSFYIGFYKEAHHNGNTKMQTVPSGTTWTIEAVT